MTQVPGRRLRCCSAALTEEGLQQVELLGVLLLEVVQLVEVELLPEVASRAAEVPLPEVEP